MLCRSLALPQGLAEEFQGPMVFQDAVSPQIDSRVSSRSEGELGDRW